MSKKALYNLIEMNYRTTHFVLPDGIRLINKSHTSGARYFLFELPLAKKTRIDNLDLISHHVSVYESPAGKIDLKSQYHYTAFFESASGTEYRLHVYYDAEDGFVTSPMLSVLNGDKYEPVDSDDLDDLFADLATAACSELVTFLRGVQKSRVGDLQRQFDELENRLEYLSSELVKNKKEYLEVITSQINVLHKLSKISNKSAKIITKMRWLTASKEIMEAEDSHQKPAPVTVSPEIGQGRENEHNKPSSSKEAYSGKAEKKSRSSKTKSVQAQPQQVRLKPAISADIEDLKLKLNSSEVLKDPELATELRDLHGRLKEKEWQVELKERTATAGDLNDLRILAARIEKAGVRVLQRLLMSSDFKHAERLNSFYHLLPDELLLAVLQMGRHELLDFLLKNNIVPVHFKNFTIKNVVYSSMVDYFFKSTAPDESRIACLDVLIKHEASLMGIDNKSGLPYAALLLSQLKHPLRVVLERNRELTLNSVDFHNRMNQVLRSLNPSSVTIDIDLDELISNNKDSITLLRKKIAPYKPHNKKLESSLGQELALQIQTDPEISYQAARIRKEVAALLPRIPPVNKNKLILLTDLNFDLLAQKLNGIEAPELIPPFEDLKRETVKLQLVTLEYIALLNEAYEQNVTVAAVNRFSSRKKIKEANAVGIRRAEIQERMSEIQSIIDDAYDELLREHVQNSLVKFFTENLSAGIFKDIKSDEEEKVGVTEGSPLRQGLFSTFFAPGKNSVILEFSASPELEDIEDSSNDAKDISSENENGLDKDDVTDISVPSCGVQ